MTITGSRTWVEEKYGVAAAERVLAWRRLMSENRNKDEPTKLLLVNDFFQPTEVQYRSQTLGKEDYWATPVEAMGLEVLIARTTPLPNISPCASWGAG